MGLAVSRQEAFWEACGFGDKIQVKKYIEEGIDVDWVSYTHNSCAIHVASQGNVDIVNMLIAAKCNVNAKDDRDSTALHQAAMKGHCDIIKLLIQAGAKVDAQDKNGWTPLISAAYFCQLEAVKELLQHGASVLLQNQDQRSALHEACRSYSYLNEDHLATIADLLIEAGSDINSKSSDRGEADFTPLMFCAYHDHPKVAQALLNAGCEVNAQGSNMWSALHWAADRGHIEVARVLIMSGIDVLLKGTRDELAVDRASTKEMYKLLQNYVDGASYNFHDPNRNAQEKLRDFSHKIFQTADDHKNIVDRQLQLLEDNDDTQSTSTFHSTTTTPSGDNHPSSTMLSASSTTTDQPPAKSPYRANQQHRYSSNSANRLSLILASSVSPLNAPPTLRDALPLNKRRMMSNGVSGGGLGGGGRLGMMMSNGGVGGGMNGVGEVDGQEEELIRPNGLSKSPIKFICDEDDPVVTLPYERLNGFLKSTAH